MLSLVPRRRYELFRDFPLSLDWADRIFEDLVPSFWKEGDGFVPAFDVAETDDHIVVKADLPGIDVKDLDISVADNMLTVKGEKKEEHKEEKENYHRIERRFGSFCRTFSLPGDVKADDIEATYKDGVLKLRIPKAESSKRKKIEVKTH